MKNTPRSKSSPSNRGPFGKKAPSRSFGAKGEGRTTEGASYGKKPRRFDRASDAEAGSSERFGKRPSFGKGPRESLGGKGKDKPYHERKFESRSEGSRSADRSESRYDKKPSFGGKDKPRHDRKFGTRTTHHRDEDRTESRYEHKSSYAPKPSFKSKAPAQQRTDRRTPQAQTSSPRPKRESLQRQGVLLWGLHAVREAWLNPARTCYRLWTTPAGLALINETLEQAADDQLLRPSPTATEKADIEHFLPHGAVHQGLALEVEPLPETTLDDVLGMEIPPEVILVLDQVTDPHNIGAILRSAAALGAGAVVVSERGTPGTTGTMAKSACGAIEHVPLVSVVNIARTLDTLKEESYWCIGLAEEGENPLSQSALASGRVALVLGAEGDGLRRLTREHCDELAHLPTQGPIGSLNVSNAAAVALYEVVRQRAKISTT